MSHRWKPIVLALNLIPVFPSVSALGQIGRDAGGIGGRPGARPAAGGALGLPSPRSGLGIRSNPSVNPSPSLTPHEVLNPRGSLSSGQVLNPDPSLRRHRSGGDLNTTQPTAPPVTAGYGEAYDLANRGAEQTVGHSTKYYFDELGDQLRQYKNGDPWAKYLALPTEGNGEQTEESTRALLRRFNKLSSDSKYAKITSIPSFSLARERLNTELEHLENLPPSTTTLPASRPTTIGTEYRLPARRTAGVRVLQSVVALDAQLAKTTSTEQWSKRLSLDELRITVSVLSEKPADDAERMLLEGILKTYEEIASDEQHTDVNQLDAFKETFAGLQTYLSPIETRWHDELILEFDRLGDQLREYKNGEAWVDFLSLPSELVSGDLVSGDLLSGEPSKSVNESTATLLRRFDKLLSDPTYAKVTTLVAFRPANEALKTAVDQHQPIAAPSAADAPPAVAESQSVTNQDVAAAVDTKPIDAGETGPSGLGQSTASNEVEPLEAPDQDSAPSDDGKPAEISDDKPSKSIHQNSGERILKSVVALKNRLAEVAPNQEWSKKLSLAELAVGVSMTSDQPASQSDRDALEEILKTYQAVAKSEDDAIINELPEFQETLRALIVYLEPGSARQTKD